MHGEGLRTHAKFGIALSLTGVFALTLIVWLRSGPFASRAMLLDETADAMQLQGSGQAAAQGQLHTIATASRKSGATSLEEHFGIQVSSVRLTAADTVLDLRYKIIDPDRAALLGERESKAHLLDSASGATIGASNPPQRKTAQKLSAGKTHFVLFANPGRLLKQGSKVSLVVGDFRADDLKIE